VRIRIDHQEVPKGFALKKSAVRCHAPRSVSARPIGDRGSMTASPPPPVSREIQALRDVRDMLERARSNPAGLDIERAIERINLALDKVVDR